MNAQFRRVNCGDVFGDVMAHASRLTLHKKLRFYLCNIQEEPLTHLFKQQV